MYRYLLTLAICLACWPRSITSAKERGKKCIITRSYKMLSADCHALDLTTIPSDIQTDIEVMDASFNRIRELQCGAFDRYSGLKLLYLGDNLIISIEEGTFMNLVDLEVLDLSLNALKTIPVELMNLKKLRKLYMHKNFIDTTSMEQLGDVSEVFTIKSLSLAFCGLRKMPPLQKFPALLSLNLSGNDLISIHPKDLAPACDLNEIDLNYNKHFAHANCECQILNRYLAEKNIKLVPPFTLNCTNRVLEDIVCANTTTEHQRETQEIYSSCVNHKLMLKEALEMKTIWWTIGSVVAGSIILLAVCLLCYKQRTKKRSRKRDYARNNNLNHSPVRALSEGTIDGREDHRPLQDRGFNPSSFS